MQQVEAWVKRAREFLSSRVEAVRSTRRRYFTTERLRRKGPAALEEGCGRPGGREAWLIPWNIRLNSAVKSRRPSEPRGTCSIEPSLRRELYASEGVSLNLRAEHSPKSKIGMRHFIAFSPADAQLTLDSA
jgi:hypothetical protein